MAPRQTPDGAELASKAAKQLLDLTDKIQVPREQPDRFAVILRANLASIDLWLENNHEIAGEDEINSVLKVLQRLCGVRTCAHRVSFTACHGHRKMKASCSHGAG